MIRSDVLKTLIPLISDELVVTNIGLPSQEMHLLDDQPTNFYMLGTMGLASSIGLGLAMDDQQPGPELQSSTMAADRHRRRRLGADECAAEDTAAARPRFRLPPSRQR